MKPQRSRVSAYALIHEDNRILLCRLSKVLPRWQGFWTLPGGGLNFGEDPEAAVVREVEEETGLRCKLVAPLGCTAYTDHKGRDKVACYWLMDVAGGRFRAGTEVDEVRWVTVDEAVELLSYRRDRALLRSLDLEATG